MLPASQFARHLCKLASLAAKPAAHAAEIAAIAETMVAECASDDRELLFGDGRVRVGSEALPNSGKGVRELAKRLAPYGTFTLRVPAGTPAAALVALGVVLSHKATKGAAVSALADALRAAGADGILVQRPDAASSTAEPAPVADEEGDTAAGHDQLPVAEPAVLVAEPAPGAVAAAEPAPVASTEPAPAPVPAAEPEHAAPEDVAPDAEAELEGALGDDPDFVIPEPTSPAERLAEPRIAQILALLPAAITPLRARRTLGELAWVAEQAFREGEPATSLRVTLGILDAEPTVGGPAGAEVRRHFVVTLKRLAKPMLLRAMARLRNAEAIPAAEVDRMLVRMGEDGAEVVMDLLANARTVREREEWMAVLRSLPSAATAVAALAADPRSAQARQAAELAVALGLQSADRALADLLGRPEPRVRASAAWALGHLDTPFSVDALVRASEDPSAEVRIQAITGIGQRRITRASASLARAVEGEADAEVQYALIRALGRLATPDAVQKLVAAADADGTLARRRPALRLSAVRALGEARTPAAMVALQALGDDGDREVRELAQRMVREARQRRTQALASVQTSP